MPGDGSDLSAVHRSRPWPFVGGVGNRTSCGRRIDSGALYLKLLNVTPLNSGYPDTGLEQCLTESIWESDGKPKQVRRIFLIE